MSSIARNAVWNMVRVGSNILFPLISFPYISRVLGPAVKGEYDYVYAVVSYFILFANLGFPIYGIREISKSRDSRKEISDTVSSIFTTNVFSVSIAFILFVLLTLAIPSNEKLLFSIVGISIVFSCIQFDWFYQGVEDFKYITIRSLVVKTLSLIALFYFVRTKEDLIAYALISVIGEFGNNIFNLFRIGKYADLRFSLKNNFAHVRGASALFLGTVAVSLYTQLNTVMLGILDTKESVGYFTAGNKLVHLILSVITAMLATIIPRISYQMGTGKKEEGVQLQHKVLKLTLYLSYPLIAILYFLAGDIVVVLAGNQYLPAIPALKILCLLVIIIPLSNFLGLQVLFPIKKELFGTYAVIAGAIVNITLNYVLVIKYSFIGISLAIVISEFVVTYVHYYFARRYFKIPFMEFLPRNCIIAVASLSILLMISNYYYPYFNLMSLIVKGVIAILFYISLLCVLKDKLCFELLQKIKVRK